MRLPRIGTGWWSPGIPTRINESRLPADELPVRYLVGAAAVVKALRLSEPYHTGEIDGSGSLYLSDMLANGLTVLLAERD